MYQYGGARAGYLPDGKAYPKNKSASPSRIADPLTGQRVVTRVDSVDSFDTFYTTSQQERDDLLSNGATPEVTWDFVPLLLEPGIRIASATSTTAQAPMASPPPLVMFSSSHRAAT